MKKLLSILLSLVCTPAWATPEVLQNKVFEAIELHQSNKTSDQKFYEKLAELKRDPEWTNTQDEFVQDYLKSLPESRQQKFASLSDKVQPADAGHAPDAKAAMVGFTPEEVQKMNTSYDEDEGSMKTWKKWALGAAVIGAVAVASPYKIIIHGF